MAAGSLLPAPPCTRSSLGLAFTWSHTGNMVPSFLELTVDAPSWTVCELVQWTCWLLSDCAGSFHAGVFAVYVLCFRLVISSTLPSELLLVLQDPTQMLPP